MIEPDDLYLSRMAGEALIWHGHYLSSPMSVKRFSAIMMLILNIFHHKISKSKLATPSSWALRHQINIFVLILKPAAFILMYSSSSIFLRQARDDIIFLFERYISSNGRKTLLTQM